VAASRLHLGRWRLRRRSMYKKTPGRSSDQAVKMLTVK